MYHFEMNHIDNRKSLYHKFLHRNKLDIECSVSVIVSFKLFIPFSLYIDKI